MAKDWSNKKSTTVSIVFSILVGLVLLGVGVWAAPAWQHKDDMKAAITSPAAGTQLTERGIEVTGTASDIPPDRYLWLVLRADQDASLYPIDRIRVEDDGNWMVPKAVAQLGPDYDLEAAEEPPISFDLCVYAADSAGNSTFEKARQDSRTQGDRLKVDGTNDAQLLAHVHLERKK